VQRRDGGEEGDSDEEDNYNQQEDFNKAHENHDCVPSSDVAPPAVLKANDEFRRGNPPLRYYTDKHYRRESSVEPPQRKIQKLKAAPHVYRYGDRPRDRPRDSARDGPGDGPIVGEKAQVKLRAFEFLETVDYDFASSQFVLRQDFFSYAPLFIDNKALDIVTS